MASYELPEPPTAEYKSLATKLGLIVAQEIKQLVSLEDALRQEHIHIYKMSDVARYMGKIKPKGQVWGWKPVRQIDLERCSAITFYQHNNDGRYIEGGTYDKPIPYPVLVTMDRIEEAMKDEEHKPAFFVSDYCARVPDPFLMVTVPSLGRSQIGTGAYAHQYPLWVARGEPDCFVIERWDEPSFR